MFKRKNKKTGIQTPKFSYTTPPPPPTRGSNAVKPNPNYVPPASVAKPRPTIYSMQLGDLKDWVKTKAKIGDVAYCHDRISDHYYMYCYRKPDDNPIWYMMEPEFFRKAFKKESKGDHKMNITGICPYETPCGWCTKWDKKCDKKIGGYHTVNPADTTPKSNIQKTIDCIKHGKLPPLGSNDTYGLETRG